MDNYVTGATIRALREKYHMTQADLAARLMVGRRRGLLDYLKKTDIERYRDLIAKLGLRK